MKASGKSCEDIHGMSLPGKKAKRTGAMGIIINKMASRSMFTVFLRILLQHYTKPLGSSGKMFHCEILTPEDINLRKRLLIWKYYFVVFYC